MNKPTELKERAEQILNSARVLFGERGLHGVSVRDIAEHAGVKKAAVFYYFNGKDELLERILEGYYSAHADALESSFHAEGTLRERIHGTIDAYLDFVLANGTYARLVQGLIANNPEWHGHVQRNLEPLFRWTEAALAELSPSEGPLAARQFFITLSGAVINTFTYAPVLELMWGDDPLSDGGISERRAHLHWVVDALMDKREPATGS